MQCEKLYEIALEWKKPNPTIKVCYTRCFELFAQVMKNSSEKDLKYNKGFDIVRLL